MDFNRLVTEIREVSRLLQENAARAVNQHVTARNWLIGHRIFHYEQHGEDRAAYGERILENLMSNARKYAEESFGVSLARAEKHTELLVFNGLSDGASVDTKRVFEPFYRMDARTSEGSGLGLYVVKLLCERLGWTVSAETGNDNIFTVKIIIR